MGEVIQSKTCFSIMSGVKTPKIEYELVAERSEANLFKLAISYVVPSVGIEPTYAP